MTALCATEVLRQMDLGALTAEAHVLSLLQTVRRLEPDVAAWAHLEEALALQQARASDKRRAAGHGASLLGVAVGLKDIIDTADLPTENGTVLHAGRRPSRDAALVTRLREAGAVIMGKTVTTELATYAPGKTRNPHRLTHTPGGSSSGSAAAVACGMVPLAIGSQTNGSTIRPGAYCGVVSFKPTRASIDRTGMLVQSPSFDTVGLFARNVPDMALLYEVLCDPPRSTESGSSALKRLGWFPSPLADRLEPGVREKLERRARDFGAVSMPDDLPVPILDVIALHRLIMEAEIARSFADEYRTGAARLSASLRGQIERGGQTSDAALLSAQLELGAIKGAVDTWMHEQGVDAWVTPSAAGPAPAGLDSTGDPIFCSLATALDLPALQLPGLAADNGLPLGTQVVGRRSADAALLTLGAQLYQP